MNNMKRGIGDKGQLSVLIIIGIIIVSVIVLFFLWVKPAYIDAEKARPGFEGCILDVVEENAEMLGMQAGFANPSFYYLHENNRVGFLCYTNLYYSPCINQKPLIKQHFEEELKKSVKAKIDACYDSSLNELRNQGYDVVGSLEKELDINIDYGKVEIDYKAPVVLGKQTQKKFTNFKFILDSKMYEMLMIATSIIQFETSFGDTDVSSLMALYPKLIIRKLKQSEGTTIYIIEDKDSQAKFKFASRSYAWPAGYGWSEGV